MKGHCEPHVDGHSDSVLMHFNHRTFTLMSIIDTFSILHANKYTWTIWTLLLVKL